jgi:transposase
MKTADTSTYTIGLDLGDRQHAACVLNHAGAIVSELTVANTKEALRTFSQQYPRATIAIETGTHSPWISRLLAAEGLKVYVANARKLRAIAQSDTKTDRHDARMLARICRADPQLLSPVEHRSEACQRALVSLKVREALVRARTAQMNSVRFLLKSLGLRLSKASKATYFTAIAREQLEAADRALVEPLLASLDVLTAQIKALDASIEKVAVEQYPETVRLRQVPGVGPLTALCFVLTLEKHDRFKKARDVGAYLGLVPRRDQSGRSDKALPITKAGNSALRCLLVNCAQYILGPFGPPTALREAGLRLCAESGKAAKKRAVIAVARKLAVTLLALWKTGRDYEATPAVPGTPFPPCPVQATATLRPA